MMRTLALTLALAATAIGLAPGASAEEECPPNGSVQYIGPCGDAGCNGNGSESFGVWVLETFVVGYTGNSVEGQCGATQFCFQVLGIGILFLDQSDQIRVGTCL